MAEPKKTAKPVPIADVAHPNKSAPADNSRSIIINRPILQDPMMTVTTDDKDTQSSKPAPASHSKSPHETILQPLAGASLPSAVSAEPSAAPDPPAVSAEPAPAAAPEPAATEAAKPDDDAKTDEPAPAVDDKAPGVDLEAEQAKQAEHEAAVQKIIESKQYFLPINAIEKRRSARFVALGVVLALVLAVAWVDVALDAGLIHLGGIKPLTHLFSS